MSNELQATGTVSIVQQDNNTGLILIQHELHRLVNIGRYSLGFSRKGKMLIPVAKTKVILPMKWMTAYDVLPYDASFVCIPVAMKKLAKFNFNVGEYVAIVWNYMIVF